MSSLRALIAIRAAIGALTWVAPRLAARLFGISADANPQLPYVARLFAARDLALALGLQISQGEARRQWVRIGIACDAADAAAGAIAGRRGELSTVSTALVTGPALAGIGLGRTILRELDTPSGASS